MRNAIVTFKKPSEASILASTRIAKFMSSTLDIPIMYDEAMTKKKLDILFLVNGAFAFCGYLPLIAEAVRKAKRVVWVQNDYTIIPPAASSGAASPFRAAFRERAERGLPPVDYWTTVEPNAALTRASAYINWNCLTSLKTRLLLNKRAPEDLFYYGAFRAKRVATFDRYFLRPRIQVVISAPAVGRSPAFKKFEEQYRNKAGTVRVIPGVERSKFYEELNSHGLGLYIEDERSHIEFHSPANRFYEMLSANLPMVFQPEAVKMLRKADIDARPYIARNTKDVAEMMRHRIQIYREQAQWHRPYEKELRSHLRTTFTRLVRYHDKHS